MTSQVDFKSLLKGICRATRLSIEELEILAMPNIVEHALNKWFENQGDLDYSSFVEQVDSEGTLEYYYGGSETGLSEVFYTYFIFLEAYKYAEKKATLD